MTELPQVIGFMSVLEPVFTKPAPLSPASVSLRDEYSVPLGAPSLECIPSPKEPPGSHHARPCR